MNKKLVSATAAFALVAFGSGAAHAATFADGDSIFVGDVEWENVNLVDGGDNNFYVDDLSTGDSGDVFDSIGYAQFYVDNGNVSDWFNLHCDAADLSDATDGSGDKILTCDPITIDGDITSSYEARFYAEGDMVRFIQTLTNGSSDAIDYDWWAWGGYGDADLYDGDTGWEVEQGQDNGEYVGAAWGLETADQFPNYIENNGDSYGVSGYDNDGSYTLDAGESVSFATFVFHNAPTSDLYPSNEYDSLEAWAADTFDSFDGRLIAGLEDGTVIANWGTAQAESDSTDLAGTGINSLGLIGLASALVLAGVVVTVRRRKA